MPIEDQVKVLENEFKLIKSELRQTLVSVRDFLLDLKVPPMQEEPLNEDQSQQSLLPSMPERQEGSGNSQPEASSEPAIKETFPPEISPAPVFDSSDNCSSEPQAVLPSGLPSNQLFSPPPDKEESFEFNDENTGVTAGEIPNLNGENTPLTGNEENRNFNTEETCTSVSQVNLLANLVRWAAVARQEIGMEQLPVFLDLYAVSGNLSAETRELILHLAQISADPGTEGKTIDRNRLLNEQIGIFMEISGLTGPVSAELKENLKRLTELLIKQSFATNKSSIWSQLLLELHGILVGQGTNMRPLMGTDVKEEEWAEANSSQEVPPPEPVEAAAEETAPKKKTVKPAKLRLVFPVNDGSEQELDLGNLFISSEAPEEDLEKPLKGNGHNQFSVV